ncbi:MAG: alpha/beta hydrolase [Bacteroidota bacterium]
MKARASNYPPINTSATKPARVSDIARFFSGMIAGGFKAGMQRMRRGPLTKTWDAKLEFIIGTSRGTYNLLTEIGSERYQRVLETALPVIDGGATLQVSTDKNLPGHWFLPKVDNGSVILYFHGGGYVYGSVRTHGKLMGTIANAVSARVFALDYRLAPEHPQPAAVDDACAAFRHLVASGISPQRIVFAGDSSGGGLVLLALIALRDAGDVLPAAGVAISPWVDLSCTDESFKRNAPYDPVTREACLVAAKAFLHGANPQLPEVSPLFADLAGLPPLLIQAGEIEVLYDQIAKFAEKAKAAGVDVNFHAYKDMVHVWHMYVGFTPLAQEAIDEIAAFVKTSADNQK